MKPAPYSFLMNTVIAFAHVAHVNQFRRDKTTPYITHPEKVANLVKPDYHAEMTAWLHDVLEDTNTSIADLQQLGAPYYLPEPVIDAVVLLTKKKNEPYKDYLEKVKRNPIARKVKIADMVSNLMDAPTKRQIEKYTQGLFSLANC